MINRLLKGGWGLPIILLVLVSGITGGFLRTGCFVFPGQGISMAHGLLMTGGFMGSLISMERNLEMKQKGWAIVPVLSMSSAVFFILGELTVGLVLLILSSIGLIAMVYFQSMNHPKAGKWMMLIGALCWLTGNLLVYKSNMIAMGSSWWEAFILLTILGERLQLSSERSWANRYLAVLLVLFGIFFFGMFLPFHGNGTIFMGYAIVGIGTWFLVSDLHEGVLSNSSENRFCKLAILLGYTWLIGHGIWLLIGSSHPYFYDVLLHTFFLGFAFSMIWGHAPKLLPLFLNLRGTVFYDKLWWGIMVFEFSLASRMVASILEIPPLRKVFVVINGLVILLMFIMLLVGLVAKVRRMKETNYLIK